MQCFYRPHPKWLLVKCGSADMQICGLNNVYNADGNCGFFSANLMDKMRMWMRIFLADHCRLQWALCVPFVSPYLCHSLMLIMIMMTVDVKPISQNCTPEAIAKKISVSSPRVVMLSQYLHKHAWYMNFNSVVLFLCYTTCRFIAAFLHIKLMMINNWLTSVGYCIRREVYKTRQLTRVAL